MKSLIAQIVLFLSAVLVLFSSGGVVISKHYCKGELKNTALFVKAKACHQGKQKHCPMHEAMQQDGPAKKGCCDDQMELADSEDQLTTDGPEMPSLQQSNPFHPLIIQPEFPVHSRVKTEVFYLNYKPPLIFEDRTLRFQIFLC